MYLNLLPYYCLPSSNRLHKYSDFQTRAYTRTRVHMPSAHCPPTWRIATVAMDMFTSAQNLHLQEHLPHISYSAYINTHRSYLSGSFSATWTSRRHSGQLIGWPRDLSERPRISCSNSEDTAVPSALRNVRGIWDTSAPHRAFERSEKAGHRHPPPYSKTYQVSPLSGKFS